MKSHRPIGIIAFLAVLALLMGSCAGTDVVAKYAKSSFKALLAASGERAAKSGDGLYWSLGSPQGDQVLLAADFAGTERPDIIMSFAAEPFLAAGLDMARLQVPEGVVAALEGERLVLKFELGGQAFSAAAAGSFAAAFDELVKTYRSRIGYHAALDHYGVSVGGGNMFEWAKDLKKNDKDIVWVLDPAPFAAAGMEPGAVEGWIFAKVETMDEQGKTVLVEKLLRPYNID